MKAGEVVYIRVSPRHVQACIALARARGLVTAGMSVASVISQGLRCALDTIMEAGIIPEPDPFHYSAEVEPFRATTAARRGPAVLAGQAIARLRDASARADISDAVPLQTRTNVTYNAALQSALEDALMQADLFPSLAAFCSLSPYWENYASAGVTPEDLAAALPPEHPWRAAAVATR